MAAQLKLSAFYPTVPTDSKAKEIRRLHSECLYAYKLRVFNYSHESLPEDKDKRAFWFFMDLSLPATHPMHPETFRKIFIARPLSLSGLKQLSYKFWMDDAMQGFDELSRSALFALIFSKDELALAAAGGGAV